MELAKQQLNLLISRINDSFPDENDLKGFLGISKKIITDTLTESDTLLIYLTENDNRFETIILKRELSELFEKINKELDEKFDRINSTRFNSILKGVTKIRSLVRETYVTVASDLPIRTEADIIKANDELKLLSSNIEELKKINIDITTLRDSTVQSISEMHTEITTQKDTTIKNINATAEELTKISDSSRLIFTDLELKQKNATESEQKTIEFVEKIESHNSAIEKIQENTTEWKKEINAAKEEILASSTEYNALNLKSKTLQAEIEVTHDKIFGKEDEDGNIVNGYLQETEDLKNKIALFLADQQKKFLAQFTEIESLLPGATSAGLAEAYQVQKASYKKPIILWSGIFIATISIMTILSLVLLIMQFLLSTNTTPTLTDALISLLKDLPFFIPTIWLAAYASKQQSQYKRLQQEYAFKETNAKSFHGHKMQIEELMKDGSADKDLLMQLVAQLVIITSQNPSYTLDNKTHEDSPPIFKFAEKIFPFFKKDGEGTKKEIIVPRKN
jgi:uncharacterized coiled-coil DUF342 family protein